MKKIIIIDDDNVIRQFYFRMLSEMFPDSDIVCVETNKEVFEEVEVKMPHVIITDYMRPGGTGSELVYELRKRFSSNQLPVIAITGSIVGNKDLELQLYRIGCNIVIRKPFRFESLYSKISQYLESAVNKFAVMIEMGYENSQLDYKGNIELESRFGRASLAKDIIAMANSGGGNIVIGVEEERPGKFIPKGLENRDADDLEKTKVWSKIRGYLDPEFEFNVIRTVYKERIFVVISIPEFKKGVVLAKKMNERASLFLGRIYIRTKGAESAEICDSRDLRKLLETKMT